MYGATPGNEFAKDAPPPRSDRSYLLLFAVGICGVLLGVGISGKVTSAVSLGAGPKLTPAEQDTPMQDGCPGSAAYAILLEGVLSKETALDSDEKDGLPANDDNINAKCDQVGRPMGGGFRAPPNCQIMNYGAPGITWEQAIEHKTVAEPGLSPIIGIGHSNKGDFWQEGDLANLCLEEIARQATNAQCDVMGVMNNTEGQLLVPFTMGVNRMGASPTTKLSSIVRVDREHPLITVASMIGPTPDWITGFFNKQMCGPEGWIEEMKLDGYGYGSGTDLGDKYQLGFWDGNNYTFPNPGLAPAKPHVPVYRFSADNPLTPKVAPKGVVAKFTIKRLMTDDIEWPKDWIKMGVMQWMDDPLMQDPQFDEFSQIIN